MDFSGAYRDDVGPETTNMVNDFFFFYKQISMRKRIELNPFHYILKQSIPNVISRQVSEGNREKKKII